MHLDALANLKPKGRETHRLPLLSLATLVALLAATPLVYIGLRALSADAAAWQRLLQARLWLLFRNTILLTAAVTASSSIIGVGLAWLTERSNLPAKSAFRLLLALPLAIPAYIGALIHLNLMRPRGGAIPNMLEPALAITMPAWNPLGFWGATFILTIFTYPYIYLLSAAAFRALNATIEEAARVFGRTPKQTFWFVVLPALRPGLTAGMLLVALDVMAEYGTVALLRYETFTSAIFVQLTGRYDHSAAAVLSGALVALASVILLAELRTYGKGRFTQVESQWRPARAIALGKWHAPALGFVIGVVTASLLIPVTALVVWSMQTLLEVETSASIFRPGVQGFAAHLWNSLWSAGLAAILAAVFSLPVAMASIRSPSRFTRLLLRICQVGYALPGVVIALSLLYIVNRYASFLYATPLVVVLAYVLRHLPQSVRGSEAAFAQIAPSLEEAAYTLGRNSRQTFLRVTLPLAFPGVLAGAALVFLTSLKELPATLLLRPAGFDTLAVRAWIWAGDGFYQQAAPAALALVILAGIPLSFLLRKEELIP